MDHPITLMMLVVGLISLGILAYGKMRVDIFPSLNTPKIYVFFDFIGMSPDQIEGFIVNELELYFQYVDGIQDIKSRNIQQVGLCELGFFHDTEMGQAMAQVVAMSDRAMAWMPPGSLPPMIMRMDAGSVPIGYLVFTSEGDKTSIGAMGDLAQNIIRPLVQKNVPGTVAISPFGPNMRSIIINVDPRKLLEYNLNPQDVVDALKTGNVVIPSGNIYIKDSMPMVHNNATVVDIQRLGNIPLKLGQNVYLRDVATIQDDTDITYGYALVNGQKAIHLPIIKKDTGSTLTVVADVHKSMEKFRNAVPPDVKISFEFDESPTVVHAVESVATEGAIGAGLTGLMILLFLRDLRSVLVVVCNIPLALTGSLFGLWVTGNTINIMSLGGMALAIGILVDEATVTIENTHVQMEETPNIATAVLQRQQRDGRAAAAGLALHPVGVHPGVHHGRPAAVAVHAADPGGRLRHDLVVPALQHVRADHERLPAQAQGASRRAGREEARPVRPDSSRAITAAVDWFVGLRWLVVLIYLVACGLVLGVLGLEVGTELFPQIDSGEFVLRFRPPPGSSYELTREMGMKCLQEIEQEAGTENISITMGFVGQVAPNFGIDNMVLFMRGPDDGWLRVKLEGGQRHQARRVPRAAPQGPPRSGGPLAGRAAGAGGGPGACPRPRRSSRPRSRTFGFEPGDIVSQVMSFGSSKPIAVRRDRHRL